MDILSRLPEGIKTLAIVVLLPMLVAVCGVWQSGRVLAPAGIAARLAEIRHDIRSLESLRAQEGPEAPVEGMFDETVTVSAALSFLANGERELMHPPFWSVLLPGWLARIELVLAVLASATGIIGILYIRQLGRYALRSRNALLKTFRQGLRVLPLGLGIFAFCFFTALVCAVAFECLRLLEGRISGGVIKLLFFGGSFALALIWSGIRLFLNLIRNTREAFRHEALEIAGRCVARDEAPALWDYVGDIARRLGARLPDAIVIGMDSGFFVTENPVRLRGGDALPRGRVLYMSMPFMAYMDKAEIASVIGHELGHFTGDDTQYSLNFAPIYAASLNHLRATEQSAEAAGGGAAQLANLPVMVLGSLFLQSFHEAVQHWSRVRELAADRFGSRMLGKEVMASALLRFSCLAPRVDQALADYWREGQGGGSLLARLDALVAREGFDDPRKLLGSEQSHPTDSHPSLARRLEALGVPLGERLIARAQDRQPGRLLAELGLASEPSPATLGSTPASAAGVSLSEQLEGDFSSATREQREAFRQMLQTMAAQGQGVVPVEEDRRFGIVCAVLVTLTLFALSLFVEGLRIPMLVASVLGVAACIALARRLGHISMELDAEGILFGNSEVAVPWTAFHDYAMRVENGSLVVTLQLKEGYVPPPEALAKPARYKPGKDALVFRLGGLRRMKHEAFAEEFQHYWQGANARAELAQLGAQV